MSSILESVKKALGINEDQNEFDPELIMHINTILATLTQIGVGSEDGFAITGKENEWSEFISDEPKWSQVKTYVYTKVRLIFDPPQSSAAIDAMKKVADELEWRIYTEANKNKKEEGNQNEFD